MHKAFVLLICLMPVLCRAEIEPSDVEVNIRAMDSNHDGQVTVTEMRAFLESQHGKDYKQALLEQMEIKAGLKSCGSPFSKSLY